jgi:formylmethanofuran dehydrogenase subunit E
MIKIGTYSYEEYIHLIKSFRGSLAPGLVIGGFMVDLAMKNLPPGEFFDAVCETAVCLPDSIQLLTPCTVGNGWLKVFEFGRFALTLYEKYSGEGVRVFLDAYKLGNWPEINAWFLKLKPKKEQDLQAILDQIKEAGPDLLSLQKVRVEPERLRRPKLGAVAICQVCHEAYPVRDGNKCRPCQGESPYL